MVSVYHSYCAEGPASALSLAHIPSLHPTRADHSVLWVWWVWVGVKVNVTVMHHSMVIYRPSVMQTITVRYPEVRVTFDKHVGH